jgi:serine/threonine protein kinase
MTRDAESLIGGRYRLDGRLGEGGFGAVYSGLDTKLKRTVAIKLLDPEAAARSKDQARLLRERFRREAIATAAIDHRNVVTVFDVGIAEKGDVYIVMEQLEGRSLGEELHRLPHGLAAERCLPHFVHCLEALGLGHAAGIVHKDLKPSNLFLVHPGTSSESMCVIDFGVARVLHEEKLTATGRIVGTPRYLAPEYIEHHEVTPALDVYQMALILVETLTGTSCVPRNLDLVGCCQLHLAGDLRIPMGLLGGEFGDVIRRATARDPGDRYRDGTEFAEALARIDPASVLHDTSGDHRPTPKLGSPAVDAISRKDKPRSRKTVPMHGAPALADVDAQPQAASALEPESRPGTVDSTTGAPQDSAPLPEPTKATVNARPAVDAEPEEVEEHASVPATDISSRPQAKSMHGLVYVLIALAAASVVATAIIVLREPADEAPIHQTTQISNAASDEPSDEPTGSAAPTAARETQPTEAIVAAEEQPEPQAADEQTRAAADSEPVEPKATRRPKTKQSAKPSPEAHDTADEPEPPQVQPREKWNGRAEKAAVEKSELHDEGPDDAPAEGNAETPEKSDPDDEMLILE